MSRTARFGDFLRDSRESQGITQYELGKRLGLKQDRINAWEIGLNRPNVAGLAKLGSYFQWDMNEVMAFFGGPKPDGKLVASAVAARPKLRALMEAARTLSDGQLDLLASSARAWQQDEERSA